MRMRKKKHLEERLEACRENQSPLCEHEADFRKAADKPCYLNFKELFGNDNPVHLEVGCGKGQFVCELAKRTPDINYIAVEVCDDVALLACEAAKSQNLKNVKFMICGAEFLLKYFEDNSVERLYLNFSCPYPKNTYKNRRLTATRYLEIYKRILVNGGEIHQKTDNMHFFEFSIEKLSCTGYKLKNISLDLHNSDFEGNIVTEYESRFSAQGLPIYRLEAVNVKEN